jgi:TetR/AcrR family transcriptional regulator
MQANPQSEPQSTEERILEAAVQEFMTKGYAGARTTAIAEAAGVTHAMLHYYFRTKDKLLDRIIESKIGTLRDIMLASLGDPTIPLFDKIKSTIENHQDFIAANPELPRFMINEVLNRPDRMPKVIERLKHHTPLVVQSLQRQIDEYADRGLCRRVDAGMLMLDIVSLNIFPFSAKPMVNALLGGMMENSQAFVEARKIENVETIMKKIQP